MHPEMRLIDLVVLVVYFLAMAAIGPIFARKNKTTDNYFLGGRSFPGWLIGLSMFATSISSITFVAYPGDAYKTAYLRFLLCLTLPVGIFIASKAFLPFYRRAQVTSAFEYLEVRFGAGTRVYAATAFLISQVTRLGLILYLVAILVQEMTGLRAEYCVLIGGILRLSIRSQEVLRLSYDGLHPGFSPLFGGFAILVVVLLNIDGGLEPYFPWRPPTANPCWATRTPRGELVPAAWAS